MRISILGGAGWVVENEEGSYHSAYGWNKWTSVQENASIYNSEEEAQEVINKLIRCLK